MPHAPAAELSGNLTKAVVAVAEVLGSETVGVLVTQNFTTRGMRVSRPAKHGNFPRQSLLNKKALVLLMVMTW